MGMAGRGGAAEAVEQLTSDLGLPTRLGELGLGRGDIEAAARLAQADHTNSTNPRRADAASYLHLMERHSRRSIALEVHHIVLAGHRLLGHDLWKIRHQCEK